MSIIRVQGLEMLLRILLVLEISWIANSFNVYEPARIPGWNYFGYSWTEPKPSVVFRKPMAAMVDLTNDLGVAILQDYSYSRSNFAFSPYGVASVLVVLYEGARGESARQIHRAVKFPWDRDITRIGFRDIHRHLRSYFSHEGYLSGITLSKEGSSLKPEYKRILRFYGYDVDVDSPERTTESSPSATTTEKISPAMTFPTTSTSTTFPTTVNEISTGSTATGNDVTTVKEIETEETNVAITTTEPEGSTMSNHDETEVTSTTIGNRETLAIDAFNATTAGVMMDATESSDVTTAQVITSAAEAETTVSDIVTEPESDTPVAANDNSVTETVTSITNSPTETATNGTDSPMEVVTEETMETSSVLAETETTIVNEAVDELFSIVPDNVTEEFALIKEAEDTTNTSDEVDRYRGLDNGMLIPQAPANDISAFDSGFSSTIPQKRNVVDEFRNTESSSKNWKEIGMALIAEGDTVKWEPKSLDEFLLNLMNSAKDSTRAFTRNQRFVPAKQLFKKVKAYPHRRNGTLGDAEKKKLSKLGNGENEKRIPVDFETSAQFKRGQSTKEKRTISEFLKVPPVTDLSLQLQNGMFDSHVSKDTDLYRVLPKFLFLVDGAIDTPVPMMTYTNIFPYAYIPRLHCKALEFPLDDERYKLLILLPVERRGLRQLIYDLSSYPLRGVIDVLHPTRVKAVVPTFMVEGFVILTPTLQKLGIWDVFDPRRSDLSGMTTDPDLYVRNIEQSVTVVIRNYVEILDIQTRTMAARDIDEDFIASHPFLYFVMDTATNVALMAGQMLDPLNSRIY